MVFGMVRRAAAAQDLQSVRGNAAPHNEGGHTEAAGEVMGERAYKGDLKTKVL